MELTIGHLYPDLLNLYGDKGNIISIVRRCQWREINVQVKSYSIDDTVDFSDIDIMLLGGGSDREQLLVARKLQSIKQDVSNFVENNGTVLAVCGGYQLMGEYYQLGDEKIQGLDIIDVYTVQKKDRLISNVILKTPFGKVVGFENHGGRTYIKEDSKQTEPFGRVLFGNGNNASDGFEGALYKNVIATYLHGPLLPKNPRITDEIIKRALLKKYGKETKLSKLDDTEETTARHAITKRFLKSK